MSSFSTNRHPLCPPFIKFKRSPKYTLPEIITIPSEDFQLPEYPTIDTSYETQMLEKYEHLKKEMEAETVMLESLAKEIQHKKSMGHLESAMHHVTLPKPMDLSEFETPADPWNLPTVTNVHEDLQQLQSSLPSYVTSSPYPNLHVSPMPTPRPGPSPPLTETTHQRALAMGFPIPAIELAIQLSLSFVYCIQHFYKDVLISI
ncbi:hypothetical protein HMI55_005310 [Coelomomyces lativittatus]|nr:hypothetical protein HMI55_005310 [Coelomomyces lativittatus]